MASGDNIPPIHIPPSLPFDQLLETVSRYLTGEALTRAKRWLIGELGTELANAITDSWYLLDYLRNEDYITENNIILLQRLVYIIDDIQLRAQLIHQIITYARQRQTYFAEYFTPRPHADGGFEMIHFHIILPRRWMNGDTSELIHNVAVLFGVDARKIGVYGMVHANSVVITLQIPKECAEMIPFLIQLGIDGHFTADVDKIALDTHIYDVKEKKEIVSDYDKHKEDFVSVYEKQEKYKATIKELTGKLFKQEQDWEDESRMFARTIIEKQLRKGHLCEPNSYADEADRITTEIIQFCRQNHTLLRNRKELGLVGNDDWTKYSTIKMLAMVVRSGLKTRECNLNAIKCYIEPFFLYEMPPQILEMMDKRRNEIVNTKLPGTTVPLVIISDKGVETDRLVATLFDIGFEEPLVAYQRVAIVGSTWTPVDVEGQDERGTMTHGGAASNHAQFLEKLLTNMNDPTDVTAFNVVQIEDDECTRVIRPLLLPRNAIYLLVIDMSANIDDVAAFLNRWITTIECRLLGKPNPPVAIVGQLDGMQISKMGTRQRHVEKYFDALKNKLLVFPIIQRVLGTRVVVSKDITNDDVLNCRQKIIGLLDPDGNWSGNHTAQYFMMERKLQEMQRTNIKAITADTLLSLTTHDGVIPFANRDEVETFLHDQHDAGNIVSLKIDNHPEYAALSLSALLEQFNSIFSDQEGRLPVYKSSGVRLRSDLHKAKDASTQDKAFWLPLFEALGMITPISSLNMQGLGDDGADFIFLNNLPSQDPRDIDTPKFGSSFPERALPIALFHIVLNRCLHDYKMVKDSLHKSGCEFYLHDNGYRFSLYYFKGIIYSWVFNGDATEVQDEEMDRKCRQTVREYTEASLKDTSQMLRLDAEIETYIKCSRLSILSDGDGLHKYEKATVWFCHCHEEPHKISTDTY